MSSSHKLDQLLDEIAATDASYGDMLMGGGALLAAIGGAVLDKLGEKPHGKANVSIELDEATVITITWPGQVAEPEPATEAPGAPHA